MQWAILIYIKNEHEHCLSRIWLDHSKSGIPPRKDQMWIFEVKSEPDAPTVQTFCYWNDIQLYMIAKWQSQFTLYILHSTVCDDSKSMSALNHGTCHVPTGYLMNTCINVLPVNNSFSDCINVACDKSKLMTQTQT